MRRQRIREVLLSIVTKVVSDDTLDLRHQFRSLTSQPHAQTRSPTTSPPTSMQTMHDANVHAAESVPAAPDPEAPDSPSCIMRGNPPLARARFSWPPRRDPHLFRTSTHVFRQRHTPDHHPRSLAHENDVLTTVAPNHHFANSSKEIWPLPSSSSMLKMACISSAENSLPSSLATTPSSA